MQFALRFLIAFLWLSGVALSNNNFFLPGDAFYPTTITAESLDQLAKQKPGEREFRYSNFGAYEEAFCGYAGYSRAKVPAVDDEFAAKLSKVYAYIRKYHRKEFAEVGEKGKIRLQETNGPRVLFYPKKFEFPRFKLALQYNEKWVEETMQFGHEREYIRLCELVNDKDAVMESWRDASLVGAFDLILPKVELVPGPAIEEPVTIKGEVQAVILPARMPLKNYFKPLDDGLAREVFVVTSAAIVRWHYIDNKWRIETSDDLIFD